MRSRIKAKMAGALVVAAVAGGLAAVATGSQTAGAGGSGGIGLWCHDGTTTGAPGSVVRTFDLEARDGYIEFPDGNTIYAWSYAPVGGAFQFPGPNLCMDEGDEVVVNFSNPADGTNLVGGIPADLTSINFAGQLGVTATGGQPGLLAQEAALGDTVTYGFEATNPGTYIYESGTDPAVQIQMGMFGGLVVYPAAGRNYAYNGPEYEFEAGNEYLMLFHEIDPVLHTSVELAAWGADDDVVLADYDPSTRYSRYWTINGRSFPDTIFPNGTVLLLNQPYSSVVVVNADDPEDAYPQLPALVRYGNAGLENHAFHPHGDTLELVGRDARPYQDTIEAFTETVAAGQTYDLLAGWEDVEAWQDTGEGPVGINLPVLNNLVFKDGVSFYSGDENLHETGQLPADVTSFVTCGEYWFPWHAHNLMEIQNFDEGFGGMLTLWRVNPPKEETYAGSGVWENPSDC